MRRTGRTHSRWAAEAFLHSSSGDAGDAGCKITLSARSILGTTGPEWPEEPGWYRPEEWSYLPNFLDFSGKNQ